MKPTPIAYIVVGLKKIKKNKYIVVTYLATLTFILRAVLVPLTFSRHF